MGGGVQPHEAGTSGGWSSPSKEMGSPSPQDTLSSYEVLDVGLDLGEPMPVQLVSMMHYTEIPRSQSRILRS